MSDREEARRALRAALAPQLARVGTPLVVIAEDLIGEEDAGIDWVASSPDGVAWVVLVDPGSGGAALLEQALVQRAWVGNRLRDWCQLAPGLPLRPDLPARALLIARDFARTTQLAAREAAGEELVLARWSGEPGEPDSRATRRPVAGASRCGAGGRARTPGIGLPQRARRRRPRLLSQPEAPGEPPRAAGLALRALPGDEVTKIRPRVTFFDT